MSKNSSRPVGRHFLHIPGPTPLPDRVLRAMDTPIIDHRGPEFAKLAKRCLDGIKTIFKTANPVIIYTATGQVCALLGNSDRPAWIDGNRPTAAEASAIPGNLVAYCGTYSVDEAGGFVVHHVELDLSPNRVGTDRKRFFTISGDRLVLRPAPPLPPGVKDWTVTWQRVR